LPPSERAPSFSGVAALREHNTARTTSDARRARPLAAAVATPPSRCRRRLNRNPELRSPRLRGTVPSQLAKFGDIFRI
jgi:hypothetical protein